MTRMLLVSMFQYATDHLLAVEPDLKGKRVAYIPTAAAVERLGFFTKISKWMLKAMGASVTVLDVSAVPRETMEAELSACDVVFVCGGNTFYLLQELGRSGADELIKREVERGKLYVGESAGAIVAAPDIAYSRAMDDPGKAPALDSTARLGLTGFYTVPHAGNHEFGRAVEAIADEFGQVLDLRVIGDKQAIHVEDGRATMLGA